MSNNSFIMSSDNIPSIGGAVSNSYTNIIGSGGNLLGFTNLSLSNWSGNAFIYTIIGDAYLNVNKKLEQVTLNDISSVIIPGCTISYIIYVTNKPVDDAGYYVIVYDKLPEYTEYKTNINNLENFIFEWSTNISPSQDYNSSDYFTNTLSPIIKSRIKWVRWKTRVFGINETANFVYRVTVK